MTCYFAYHTFQGDRGLFAWWQLQKQVVRAETMAQKTDDQKSFLEKRVRLLNPGSLDPDMLDERARLMLNFGHRDDVVFIDSERKY
ncbi:MAG: hypothetical protein CBB68_04670 [Rhodospirillaceae bacterium TMED8]|nr:MAG: hypothetical protein CBB68_04670 [Rhodospirillaceae bacterium TMED8]